MNIKIGLDSSWDKPSLITLLFCDRQKEIITGINRTNKGRRYRPREKCHYIASLFETLQTGSQFWVTRVIAADLCAAQPLSRTLRTAFTILYRYSTVAGKIAVLPSGALWSGRFKVSMGNRTTQFLAVQLCKFSPLTCIMVRIHVQLKAFYN